MPDDDLTSLADLMLRLRRQRSTVLPAKMFGGEQAWDLLLILFVADGRGERLSGRMALEKEGGSVETGRRLMQYLTELKLIVGDGRGRLDDVLTLTPLGLHELENWLSEVREAFAQWSLPPQRSL